MKKVKQLPEDKNETEDKLQKELEFYKKYYEIDQYNRGRGRCIAKKFEEEDRAKKEKDKREKKELEKKLRGDGGLGNEGKEKQCAEFHDASEIEHKETDEYSSGGTKTV